MLHGKFNYEILINGQLIGNDLQTENFNLNASN